MTADLTLALERRLVNAWPSFEVELAEGWLLRFAEGYSKRANSATPIVPGAGLDAGLVDAVAQSYAARGLPVCFRLTGIEDPACETVLARQGLVPHEPSLGLAVALGDAPAIDPAITLAPVPAAGWIAGAAAAVGGNTAKQATLASILGRIRQPAAFATLSLDGEDAAWGYAVLERGYVGIYDIAVAPELRGLGLGRRLVCGLMGWGRTAGATHAYLQMVEANEIAFGLYRSLGFEIAYRYIYHLAPAADGSPGRVGERGRRAGASPGRSR